MSGLKGVECLSSVLWLGALVHWTLIVSGTAGLNEGMNDAALADVQQYCIANTEAFEAKCLKNEVVVITSALYGRMRIGRCLEDEGHQLLTALGHDPQFLGCSEDVLQILDKKCSGRNQCQVRNFDEDLQRLKPCHAALKLYLEASYRCVAVIEADRSCHVSVTSNPLHIMRSSTIKLSCGTKSQPWTLEAPAGQQINVSLLDFGQRATENVGVLASEHVNCLQNDYIMDRIAKKNLSICTQEHERQRVVYTSHTNAIQIVFGATDSGNDKMQHKLMLGFQAIGCTDLVPPEDTWLRRSNNEAVVGCYTSRQSWHLRCVGDLWIGVIGNCTIEPNIGEQLVGNPTAIESSTNQYQVMIVISIGFLALAICLIIICTGAVCLRRHYALSMHKHCQQLDESHNKHWSTAGGHASSSKPMLVFEPSKQSDEQSVGI